VTSGHPVNYTKSTDMTAADLNLGIGGLVFQTFGDDRSEPFRRVPPGAHAASIGDKDKVGAVDLDFFQQGRIHGLVGQQSVLDILPDDQTQRVTGRMVSAVRTPAFWKSWLNQSAGTTAVARGTRSLTETTNASPSRWMDPA